MTTCPDEIKRLIEHFDHQSDQVRSPDYNEAQLRIDFVNPLFAALGWDMDNSQRFAEQYREVVHEDRVKVAGQTKAPDYSFRIGGVRKFFLEAKKPFVNLKESWEPAYQLRRYGWSAKLAVSILTDFEELAVYDCRIAPKQLDKAATARREYMTYREYPQRWEFLEGTFSKRAVLQGDFDRYCQTAKGRGREEFDDTFLEEIEEWRKKLASNLALRNEALEESALNFSVQRIIDRIVFLRMAEDRGTEPTGQLQALLNGESIYARLGKLFRDADARYNSGIFHFEKEKGRDEAPDTLTPSLDIDDATLKGIIRRLYYPESPYEFTVVSADILGSVYERFLGKVITLTSGHRAKIEEKPEVRKAGGVFYTPTYIVDYIVRNTVGKLLEGKTPKEASKLKVLDPACGSGSFLIGAYQFLLDWHLAQHTDGDAQKLATGKSPVLRPGPEGGWRLTIAERKRILLDNIHGVDLDAAAVEVTKLNLLLKCLEGETKETLGFSQRLFRERALPDLGHNILCGNSLIGTDIMATEAWQEMSDDEKRRLNPFDYEREFAKPFKAGGFDAVIGNPPYIRMEVFKPIKAYLKAGYKSHGERSDLYAYFMERGHRLLKEHGLFGMIVSNKFVRADYGAPLRAVLTELGHPEAIADFAGLPVFEGATVRTLVYLSGRGSRADYTVRYAPPPPVDQFELIRTKVLSVGDTVAARGYDIPSNAFASTGWRFARAGVTAIMERISVGQKTLAEIVDGQICMGVKSGLIEAFIVDQTTRNRLIAKNPRAKEILKPLINGRDVRRYSMEDPQQYLIYTYHGIDIGKYPAIAAHLKPFREKLEQRATRQEWYELQQPQLRFAPFMDNPKLIFPDIATEPRFTLDENGFYGTNTVYFIPRADKYLLGLLNSRLAFFFFREICAGLEGSGDVYLRFFGQYLERFPVASAQAKQRTAVANAAATILSLHVAKKTTTHPQKKEQIQREIDATDRQIDQLVYKLYGLNQTEIRIVEEN